MSIEINELLDDNAFDPKKLFDENEYSTLIINREGFNRKENSIADMLEELLGNDITRPECEAIFQKLKDAGAQELMVDAIKMAARTREKVLLTAACWETGLDFSAYFLYFVELGCSRDFTLALEAITVVEQCEGPFDKQTLEKAMALAEQAKLNEELIQGMKETISTKAIK
jgi:hypothetical protein